MLFVLFVIGFAHASNQIVVSATPLPLLKVQGNRIVDPKGHRVILKGLNVGYPFQIQQEGHWSEAFIKEAASWGAKLLRIYIDPQHYRQIGIEKTFMELDQAVEWSKKYGMYVMLDWHSIGNPVMGIFQPPWEEAMRTTPDEMKEFWAAAATHYKDEPAVAFYEIFNEPSAIPWKGGRLSWKEWRDVADSVIDVIYSKNPNAIPVVGGLEWAYDLTGVAAEPLKNTGIVFAAHPYPGHAPKDSWEAEWERHFGYLSKEHPVMLTEFGFDPNDTVLPSQYKADKEYGKRILKFADKHGMSWTAFVFVASPGWPMRLIKDWNYTPTESGAFFKKRLHKD
jgi:hypothetical protein